MYRIIHANFSHHHPATPIKKAGRWNVYRTADVEEGWPNNGQHILALEMTEEQITWLEENDEDEPYEQWPLPEIIQVSTSPDQDPTPPDARL